ncbi:MAG: HAMP domain-containing protein [Gemmatimonadetes bacterium]|nr:HAMP domain-containing protein [Gemmatimonadota bacterium]
MPLRSLSTRIALPAGFFALISVAALSWLLIQNQREAAFQEAIRGSESLAETIQLAMEQEMRVNARDAIRQMVTSVGRQEGIEDIRIFNKQGHISFSSHADEVGKTLDMQAPECQQCHSDRAVPDSLHPRITTDADGHQVLATMRAIPNQEGCQGAQCHASPAETPVLGVLDVAMSLEPAEARLSRASWNAFGFSLFAVALITGTLFLMVWASVRRPLNTIVAATRRVAHGDPTVEVPRGTPKEIGILATSFNEMVEGLNTSRSHLEEWASSLQEKVSQKALELQEAQFQVVQAEKLSSVGLVAAGIAHELNSPLMAIITFTHLVKKDLPAEAPAQEDLRMIEREANRCAAIIRQLLDYSRKQSQEPKVEPCRIAAAVAGALDLVKVEIQNGFIEAHVSIPDDLPTVDGNPVQLMQVLVNLVMNAVQAMPRGGELHIEADVVARSAYANVALPPHPGRELVRTVVRDTGTGIPTEALTRVFDPFFTTKPVGKGSGLGLSVSLGLVRSYRGTILVDSDGQTGTAFTILLPISETFAAAEEATS